MKSLSLSKPKHSYFFNKPGIFFNKDYYFSRIFLPSRPYTPKIPIPMIFLPFEVAILPFNDSHRGKPVNISSNIAPNDHIS